MLAFNNGFNDQSADYGDDNDEYDEEDMAYRANHHHHRNQHRNQQYQHDGSKYLELDGDTFYAGNSERSFDVKAESFEVSEC